MINVVNIRKHVKTDADVYIGRTNRYSKKAILGNPYSHMKGTLAEFLVPDRNSAVSAYEDWILQKIDNKDIEVLTALNEILHIHETYGFVNLVCWCAPLSCHGDVLKKILEQKILECKYFN